LSSPHLEASPATTFRACSSPAPTPVKLQPAPAILSQESVHTTLSITHHTRKRPSTDPRTTHSGKHVGLYAKEVPHLRSVILVSMASCHYATKVMCPVRRKHFTSGSSLPSFGYLHCASICAIITSSYFVFTTSFGSKCSVSFSGTPLQGFPPMMCTKLVGSLNYVLAQITSNYSLQV
jgi:hypothetical protein